MLAPWAGVPAPDGKPVPSGSMLISQAVMAVASIGLPRLGPSAAAAAPPSSSASQTVEMSISLRIDMPDLAAAVDRPAGNGIEVLVRKCRKRRHRLQLAAFGNEFGTRRLHVACLIPGAALQDCGTAVPAPGH